MKRLVMLSLALITAFSALTGCSSGTDKKTNGIDVDLTSLNSTMVFSEVYCMVSEPKEYIGKTVRMNGIFATYHDEEKNKDYFAVIIQDATACCQQGLEFTLEGDYSYPDDYPELGSEITVEGVFSSYEEDGNEFYELSSAKIAEE